MPWSIIYGLAAAVATVEIIVIIINARTPGFPRSDPTEVYLVGL